MNSLNPIPDGWHVVTKLMDPPLYEAQLWRGGVPIKLSKLFKTGKEADDFITSNTKPHHELDPE